MRNINYKILLIGILSIVFNLLLHNFGVYSLVETKLYDLRFKIRGPLHNSKDKSDIVLVEVDDEAYRLIPEPYPYPRGNIWARVVRNLTDAGAKVIAFDIQFDSDDFSSMIFEKNSYSECNSCEYEGQDQKFKQAINYAQNNNTKIVLASKIGYEPNRIPSTYLITPNDLIMESNPYIGLVDHEVDAIDNVSRRYSIFSVVPSEPMKKHISFGVQSALAFLDLDQTENSIIQDVTNDKIKVNNLSINAFRKEASFLINYYGPPSSTYSPPTFPRYSVSQVIDNVDYNILEQEDSNWMDMYINPNHNFYKIFKDRSPFKNKIVIIGSSLKEDHDFNETPFFSYGNNEYPTPGLEFHANAIQQLIDGQYIRVPTKALNITSESFIYHLLIIMFLVFITLLLSNSLNVFTAILSIISLCLVWFSISMGLFINDQFWFLKTLGRLFTQYDIRPYSIDDTLYLVPVFYPIATILTTYGLNLSYNLFNEQKNKLFLRETFGRYLSPKLIDDIYTSKKMPELGGQSGVRTAFFSDIASFSTIAEELSPSELVELLNEFLSEQTEILINNQGTLDKYQGDAIIAFFGAPIFMEEHAKNALDTGVDLQNNLLSLKKRWEQGEKNWPNSVLNMDMRIGINTGEMVTGNMGSKLNMNYTMMGEEVNLAARLESGAKLYGISFHTTYDTLKNAGLENYEWRYIDRVIFKGFSEWRQTVEIFGYKGKVHNNIVKLIKLFNQGLKYYYKQDFDNAIKYFERSIKYETNSDIKDINPSNVFINRCYDFIKNKPDTNWDGHYKLDKK
jgi:adenylate cyclase